MVRSLFAENNIEKSFCSQFDWICFIHLVFFWHSTLPQLICLLKSPRFILSSCPLLRHALPPLRITTNDHTHTHTHTHTHSYSHSLSHTLTHSLTHTLSCTLSHTCTAQIDFMGEEHQWHNASDNLTKFFSSFYRASLSPTIYTETSDTSDKQLYRGFDGQV